MTPLQFARAQCANFDSTTGGCKGIGIKDDGMMEKRLWKALQTLVQMGVPNRIPYHHSGQNVNLSNP
jgi:hypothetical protein